MENYLLERVSTTSSSKDEKLSASQLPVTVCTPLFNFAATLAAASLASAPCFSTTLSATEVPFLNAFFAFSSKERFSLAAGVEAVSTAVDFAGNNLFLIFAKNPLIFCNRVGAATRAPADTKVGTIDGFLEESACAEGWVEEPGAASGFASEEEAGAASGFASAEEAGAATWDWIGKVATATLAPTNGPWIESKSEPRYSSSLDGYSPSFNSEASVPARGAFTLAASVVTLVYTKIFGVATGAAAVGATGFATTGLAYFPATISAHSLPSMSHLMIAPKVTPLTVFLQIEPT